MTWTVEYSWQPVMGGMRSVYRVAGPFPFGGIELTDEDHANTIVDKLNAMAVGGMPMTGRVEAIGDADDIGEGKFDLMCPAVEHTYVIVEMRISDANELSTDAKLAVRAITEVQS